MLNRKVLIIFSIIILVSVTFGNSAVIGEKIEEKDDASVKEKVVLLHGYAKGSYDMITLKEELEHLGYESILVDLPLTFNKVEEVSEEFEKQMKEIIDTLESEEKLHLVGHSTGGLIIRYFLSNSELSEKVHRAVLIATPTQGSQLAERADEISETFTSIFATLESLKAEEVEKLNLEDPDHVEIGAIAGDRDYLLLGHLLDGDNDGRVRVESVKYPGLKDFKVLPFHHDEIHQQEETARWVMQFLTKGKF